MAKKGNFCPHCGQKAFSGRVTMRDLMGRFVRALFHVDNKFLKMAWQLFVPAKVTQAYFQGRIRRYPHPLQFFFIVMFLFLLLFSKEFEKLSFNNSRQNGDFVVNIDEEEAEGKTKAPARRVNTSSPYEALLRYHEARSLHDAYKALPEAQRSALGQKALDSLLEQVYGNWEALGGMLYTDTTSEKQLDSIPFNFVNRRIFVALDDLVSLEPDSIIARYQIHEWGDKVLIRQGIKSLKDPRSIIRTYVGSFAWTVLALVALMAFVLYLLYWRRGRYYAEHFIFLVHQHAGAYLLLTILLVFNRFVQPVHALVWVLAVGGIAGLLWFAMRRYYGQGWFKTTLKWLIYCTLYALSFLFLFILGIIITFMFF
jgi:hypothetical protein